MIYFTADTHFGHENIIKLCDRPFANKHDMDHTLISNWNDVVTDSDTVYHLGDFGFKSSAAYLRDIMGRLNGKIILIRGNHDKNTIKANNQCDRFDSVHDMLEIDVDGKHVFLCHYPTLEWPRYHQGSYHLFGHVHGNIPSHKLDPRQADVGVDVHDYTPVTFDQLINMGRLCQT